MSFYKPQVSFSLNFVLLFSVIKDNSSVLFKVKRFILCTKETNQSGHFEDFECSGQNSPISFHFWNNKSVFLRILHYSLGSWDINPRYFWNFVILFTFNKRSLSKYKFGDLSREQSKIRSFALWSFRLSKSYKVSAKKVQKSYLSWHRRVIQNLKKIWLVVSSMIWGISRIFTQLLKSLKISFRWALLVWLVLVQSI